MSKKPDVVASAVPLLTHLGFRKRTGYLFTIEITPNVLGWLGLNRATKYQTTGEVEINPVIGVRFQDVERIVAEDREEGFHPYVPATISTSIGYAMTEQRYRSWVLLPNCSVDVVADMTRAIATSGLSFMRSVTSLPELRGRLDERLGPEHLLVYRRPAAALLAGDLEGARSLLDDATRALDDRTTLAAIEFRRFAKNFRNRLLAARSA
jgi:hypothetical protein